MNSKNISIEATPEMLEAARSNPDGWVYKIDGTFGADEYVPPEAIVGAWKVDGKGNLIGEFIPNSKYKAKNT